MLICHCKLVNDRRIRDAVIAGARTVGQVGRACGAGTCCGGCVPAVAELVESGRLDALSDSRIDLPIAAE